MNVRRLAIFFLLAWFAFFCWDAVPVHFAPDDMMNMAYYLRVTPLQMLVTQFVPWRGPYRPLAGLFYVPLLTAFGLNPAPFHLVLLAVVLANVFLVYRFARLLGSGELAAAVAALLVSYHAGLSVLYFQTSFVFDVLCCFFYFAALVWYVRIRARGRMPDWRQTTVFLALYLAALNSKEMAVTLPLILLAYEWFYGKVPRAPRRAARWLLGPGRTTLAAAALTLPYIYGKALRPNALIDNPAYRPELSMARLIDFQVQSWSDILEHWNLFGWQSVLVFWLVLTYLAWRCDRPLLRFCWFFFLVTPLPIEFLVARVGACLAIPYCGLAIFAGVAFIDGARHAADFLGTERWFRRFRPETLFAALCLLGVFFWAEQNHRVKQWLVKPAMDDLGRGTWDVITQLRLLHPQVRPHSTVVFQNDPFTGFDMAFIAEAWFRDRSLDIRLPRLSPLSPRELANAPYVFTFERGKLVQVR